ncbi:MAG: UDP-3-O-acyl-N-acetylglucosamine deacetylase [Thermodesulfobacteriota bacterium]
MELQQRTLAKPVTMSGVGVHSGKKVTLTLKPAPINHGIQFRRVDLPDSPRLSAHFNRVVDTSLATVIGEGGCIVSTIEHLMAAFAGMSVDNALVELDNYELPIMDGSAAPFVRHMREAGFKRQSGAKCFLVIQAPIHIREGNKSVRITPAPHFRITCTIDFPHPLIGRQTYSLEVADRCFEKEIAGARTFGFLHEIEYLKRFGLARGGTLENALVISEKGILNKNGLRFPDEFVRHKILDSIGDFSLLGLPILGHVEANRSGHAFNHAFLKEIFARKEAWETRTYHDLQEFGQFNPQLLAV